MYKNVEFCTKLLTFENFDVMLVVFGVVNMVKKEFNEKIKHCIFIIRKLKQLGVYYGCIGFAYLVKVLDFVLTNDKDVYCFNSEVYPEVAKYFGVNENTIERNIRNLIKILCRDRVGCELFDCENPPTCCKFIYILKDIIRSSLI